VYFDGSKRVEGVGVGVVLISPQGDKLKYGLGMSFPNASNNEAEYEALHGMKWQRLVVQLASESLATPIWWSNK
jgi:ribonuclease HI